MTDIHSCSYYCDRPECIKAQRDELRRMFVETNGVQGNAFAALERIKRDKSSYPRRGRDEWRTDFDIVLAALTASGMAVPDEMLDRIDAAIQRIVDGHAPRRVPADPTDVDLVLAEVRSWLTGQGWPPFWISVAPSDGECHD